MNDQIRKHSMNISIMLLFFWAVMSIIGAFWGSERAKSLFNALPMAVFWCILLVLLLSGFVFYRSLRRRLGLKVIHLGCCLVLAGGMLGSEKGQALISRLNAEPYMIKGLMALPQGQSSSQVHMESPAEGVFELPFTIHLDQARIEYYESAAIRITFDQGLWMTIPNKMGKKYPVTDDIGAVEVTKVYQNLKLSRQDGKMVPYEAGGTPDNPAYEITLTKPDGATETHLVFENIAMHKMPNSTFYAEFLPSQMVKDYLSTLEVIENGKVVKKATIEVNKPLYFGGYHFYQHTFGYDDYGPVSGLMVTSARGVWIVFAGYGLVFGGLIGHFWFGVLARKIRSNQSRSTAVSGGAA